MIEQSKNKILLVLLVVVLTIVIGVSWFFYFLPQGLNTVNKKNNDWISFGNSLSNIGDQFNKGIDSFTNQLGSIKNLTEDLVNSVDNNINNIDNVNSPQLTNEQIEKIKIKVGEMVK